MYTIYTKGRAYLNLNDGEFVSIRSILQYNNVPYQWTYHNV